MPHDEPSPKRRPWIKRDVEGQEAVDRPVRRMKIGEPDMEELDKWDEMQKAMDDEGKETSVAGIEDDIVDEMQEAWRVSTPSTTTRPPTTCCWICYGTQELVKMEGDDDRLWCAVCWSMLNDVFNEEENAMQDRGAAQDEDDGQEAVYEGKEAIDAEAAQDEDKGQEAMGEMQEAAPEGQEVVDGGQEAVYETQEAHAGERDPEKVNPWCTMEDECEGCPTSQVVRHHLISDDPTNSILIPGDLYCRVCWDYFVEFCPNGGNLIALHFDPTELTN